MKRNAIKTSAADKVFTLCNTVFLLLVSVVMLYPMVYVLLASVSDPIAFMRHKGVLLSSQGFSLASYARAFENPMLIKSYGNTLFILVVGVLINLILTSCGAYFLTRKGVRLQRAVSIYIIITMFFSGGMIPFYFVVRNLGLENSLWSLIWTSAISTYNMMILKVSFAAVPEELLESAKLDGAGHLTILFRVILPVTKASIAVIGLYYAVSHWNAWFHAMLFLNEREKFPLQLILREILINSDTSSMTMGADASELEYVGETVKYAVIIISTLPILCVYPFIQKYFTKGAMIGAVKG